MDEMFFDAKKNNEALSREQLKSMDGMPVYLWFMLPDEFGWNDQWALVDADEEIIFNANYSFSFDECIGHAYRFPKEYEQEHIEKE